MNQLIDFRTPAAGFDQPLALWHACHVRVLRMVGLIERLRDHLQRNPVDDTAQTTATSIRRYFNEAAPRHHEDEEQDIFPRLRARLPTDAAEPLARAMTVLQDEHESLGALWFTLDAALAEIEQGRTAELDEVTVLLFVSGYRRHCEVEDTAISSALERHLTADDLKEIGRSMAARRGVDWADLTGAPL
jgi:hemerythrin-like domain-containing protein